MFAPDAPDPLPAVRVQHRPDSYPGAGTVDPSRPVFACAIIISLEQAKIPIILQPTNPFCVIYADFGNTG